MRAKWRCRRCRRWLYPCCWYCVLFPFICLCLTACGCVLVDRCRHECLRSESVALAVAMGRDLARRVAAYLSGARAKEIASADWTTISMSGLAILVQSARENFERRAAIRESWGRGGNNVFFIVGDSACPVPPMYREHPERHGGRCVQRSGSVPATVQRKYDIHVASEQRALEAEAAAHPSDMVFLPMVDSYYSLSHKMLKSYRWALENHPNVKWLMKADDDMYIRAAEASRR